ncbi:DUF1003 domain-containing protein [uncultured Brevundimonas sp.]|uniref:DUF1003 domain-containing protein n=1 Tax=uncultured Brevundimonas sp. TaxID=213418 RepID=UPI0025D3BAB9|nr:DUF1003 domain-containing protein [uncultured Brevundimonas sp.]
MSHAPVDADHVSRRWLGKATHDLPASEASVVRSTADRRPISEDVNEAFADRQTFGERLADRVAAFGGSWPFIIAFGVFLAGWTALNLLLSKEAFDPYPFIFLNLVLSMLAAVQAPVIMMSQNRQAARDRLDAGNDYQVNLKAEIEIMALLDKVEHLTARQEEQTEMILRLLAERAR